MVSKKKHVHVTKASGDVSQPSRNANVAKSLNMNQNDSHSSAFIAGTATEVVGLLANHGDTEDTVVDDALSRSLVLALLAVLAKGVWWLSRYKCKEAVEAFQTLPPSQYNTNWVFCHVGRAYYEMSNYLEVRCVVTAANT